MTDDEKITALDDLENRVLTLAAPFLAAANKIKMTMEQIKND